MFVQFDDHWTNTTIGRRLALSQYGGTAARRSLRSEGRHVETGRNSRIRRISLHGGAKGCKWLLV